MNYHFSSFGNPLRWLKNAFFAVTTMYGGSGGGAPANTSSQVTTSNIPDYMKPYAKAMLGGAMSQAFNVDKKGNILSTRPYSPFTSMGEQDYQTAIGQAGRSVADFSGLQNQAFASASNLGLPEQYGQATDLATASGAGSLGIAGTAPGLMGTAEGYGAQGAGYGAQGAQAGQLGMSQAQEAAQSAAGQAGMYGAGAAATGLQGLEYGAQGAQAGQLGMVQAQRAAGMAGRQAGMYGAGASDVGLQGLGYGALGAGYGAQAAGMAGQGYGAQGRYEAQATSPAAMQAYMNPYIEASLAPQLQLLNQQTGIRGAQQQSAATSSGAFGGSRSALANALNQQAGNLAAQQAIGQGYNQAYQNAQQALQYGSGLGIQGLQAGTAAQQAGMQGAGLGIQGISPALQGYQTGLQGVGQQIQAGQLGLSGAGMGIQGAQAGIAGISPALQGFQTGLQGVGQQIGAGQLGLSGAQTGIQGAQAGMQGAGLGLQGVQGAVGAGQLGLQGYGQAGQTAGTLANIGQQQLQGQQGIIGLQSQLGGMQQQQEQNVITQAMQDYNTAQQYPYQQYSFLSNLIRGLPMQSQTQQTYQAAPNPMSQVAGLGIAGAGLYGAMSDIRTKDNIKPVGRLKNGLTQYEFNYKPEFGDPNIRYRGVMAQEVEQFRPEAVGVMPNGYKYVNYAMIGTRMEAV